MYKFSQGLIFSDLGLYISDMPAAPTVPLPRLPQAPPVHFYPVPLSRPRSITVYVLFLALKGSHLAVWG